MKTSDFYYDLPKDLIAQTPIEDRDHSRLMVLDRDSGEIKHKRFFDIADYLEEGDCLILNDSKVLPARIFGIKESTGAVVEFLLLSQKDSRTWETLVKPGKKAKLGDRFVFADGMLRAEIKGVNSDGNRIIEFLFEGDFFSILNEIGTMPLPPYITKHLENQDRYQTVYSKELGSAAAPTAGLHFTESLIKKIEAKGVKIGFVTLHVGLGTFRPVKAENVLEHKMHSEHYFVPEETANIINITKKRGGKVICVGTTACRTLESVMQKYDEIRVCDGWTDIFIYPGYKFKVMDALITNFHLPESTLIMLVSAFAGNVNTFNAYNEAVNNKYRFFSFGDAMFIKSFED